LTEAQGSAFSEREVDLALPHEPVDGASADDLLGGVHAARRAADLVIRARAEGATVRAAMLATLRRLGGASLIRLASMLAIEQDDEWHVGRRDLSAHSMEWLLSAGLGHTPRTKRRSSRSPRTEQPRSPTRRALPSYTASRDLTVGARIWMWRPLFLREQQPASSGTTWLLRTTSGSPPPRLTDGSIRDELAVSPAVASLLLSGLMGSRRR
jgi:hypothetical protein